MKCHYCHKPSEEVFRQGNLIVFGHRECAVKRIEEYRNELDKASH